MSDSSHRTSEVLPAGKAGATLPWWTWVAPLVLFHLGTGLSLQFQVTRGMSLWYLPIPMGIILIHWWGPRVLVGLYLNAMLCAGYWGLYRWWYWPLYAIPETLKVGLSWWLFAGLFKGRSWLPDLRNVWGFLLLGILVPGLVSSFFAQGQLALLGDIPVQDFARNGYMEFVLDLLSPFAISIPVLLFATSLMERNGLTLTRGAHPRPSLLLTGSNRGLLIPEAGILFASLLALSFFVSLDRYWFVYGIFLIWAALRWGVGLASLATVWTIFVSLLLPFFMGARLPGNWLVQADLHQVNLNLATLCFAALVVGRALSDRFQEIDRRALVEEDLRRTLAERLSMEQKVAEEQDRYRVLFESSRDAIVLGNNGVTFDCNGRALEVFGATREDFIGAPATRFFPAVLEDGTDAAERMSRLREAAMAGNPQNFEWRMRRMDGTHFDAEVSFVGVTVGGLRVNMVSVRDISARKRIERALMESEERFRQMAENIAEVFFLVECATETMLYVSPVAETIMGIPLEKIIRRPLAIDEYTHPDDRVRMGFFVDGAWKKRAFNEDFRFIRPDGQQRWLRLRSFLIRDKGGEVFRVAGVVADITEYKTAQEEARVNQQHLIQADKMNSLGLMVSGVAHEINNPNNLIMLNSDVMDTFWKHMRPVLRNHHAANPDWRLAGIPYATAEGKYEILLGGVSGGSKRIKRIVDNLKEFARTDGGDISENVSMEKVVEASVNIIGILIRKSTDRFSVVHGMDLPRVRGNFQKLEQVIINLITNACQALEGRQKAIRIITWHEKERNMVGVRVEDEGRGIPAGLIGRITDPFFTTKRDTGGTGLGLSVTYGIVREHRGHIEFKSEESLGTTVEVRIPVQQEKT